MHKGNAISSLPAGHYFYIAGLQRYGLAVMSREDFKEIIKESNSNLPGPLHDYAGFDIFNFLTTEYGAVSFQHKLYDASGGYTIKTYTLNELIELLDYVNDTPYKERIETANLSNKEKKIAQIQNSPEGCLIANRNWTTGKDLLDDNGYSKSVKLYFHKKHQESTNRVPAFKSDTMFTAHPRRRSGAKYAFKQSLKEDTGVYVGKVNITESDFASMVSAPLKMIYNHTEGMWESSSSFLCMLLDDIDAAEILDPAVSPDGLDYDSDYFYGGSASASVSDFKTGSAMPMTVQDNNPRSFGPNIVKYDSKTKVEKVRVVNRTTQLFSKGEIALVMQIDGENLLIKISGEGVIQERPPAFKGPWLFSKFLASSDDYFRLTNGDFVQAGDEVIDFVYDKFYNTNETRLLSIDYFQDNALNQTKSSLGRPNTTTGTLPDNAYSERINVAAPTQDSTSVIIDDLDVQQINMFWGPVFNGGYAGKKFKDRSEFQIPAEVATLGPFKNSSGEYDGSPIEDHQDLILKINGGTPAEISNLRSSPNRYIYASGWNAKPNDANTIQFSLCSAELYAHLDSTTRIIDAGNFSGTEKQCRNFYDGAAQFHGMAPGTNLFGNASFGNVASKSDAGEHLYTTSQTYAGPKYDAFVQKEPSQFHRPQGCYDMFGDDNLNPQYLGANAVGTTCGRRLVFRNGNWTLNVDTEQVFGTQGVFYGGGGGGSINLTILPFIGSWVNDTRGKTIQGTTVVWGSSMDRIESFGTAALHVQVYDGWPREDTLWLSQYAQPLHFNPAPHGSIGAEVETEVDSWNSGEAKFEKITVKTKALETRVDYTVPTKTNYAIVENSRKIIYTPGYALSSDEIAVGVVSPDIELKSKKLWISKFDRRGQLVTKYGYKYDKKVIGVGGTLAVVDSGDGFEVDQRCLLSQGVAIKVTAIDANGGITSFVIANSSDFKEECATGNTESENCPLIIPDRSEEEDEEYNYTCRGEGFDPQAFDTPVEMLVTNPNGGGSATVSFSRAYCWERPMWDYGPKDQSGMVRVSKPSEAGQKRVVGVRSTQVAIDDNQNSPFPGEYEIFTYCHNDIGIALHNNPDITTGIQMHNYIKATFS